MVPCWVRAAGEPVVPGQRRRPADADLGMGVGQEPGGVTLLDGGEHLQDHPNVGIGVHTWLLPLTHRPRRRLAPVDGLQRAFLLPST
jgi:hypothetical protein